MPDDAPALPPRPRGVTFLAIVFGVFGVLLLVGGLTDLALGALGLLVVSVAYGVALLVAAVGLWKVIPWAYLLAGFLLLGSAAQALLQGREAGSFSAGAPQWFKFGLSIVGIGYLTFPDVRRAFAARRKPTT